MGYCMKKTLRIILLILIFLCMVVIFSKIFTPNKTASLFGLKAFVIKTETMQPNIEKGDLVITRNTKFDKLRVNDTIIFKVKNDYNVVQVVRKIKNNKITTSSNIKQNRKFEVTENVYQGKYLLRIPHLGNFVLFVKSIYGVIITVILVIFLVSRCITQKKM